MFERFTEKARTAVVLAQQQARERGDDDDRHRAPAARAVRGAGQPGRDGAGGFSVRHAAVEADLDRRAGRARSHAASRSPRWASTSTRCAAGRGGVRSGRARAHPRGRAAGGGRPHPVRQGVQEGPGAGPARGHALGHNYIGTEHMLLGMLRGGGRARRAGGAWGAAGRRAGDRRGAGAGPPRGVRDAPCEHRPVPGAHRRRHDLPGLPRAPARGAARPRDRARAARPRRARPAQLDPRRAPGGRRRPLRRRPRHGDAAAGVGRGARRRASPPGRPPRLVVPTPAGRPFTQATAQEWAAEPRLVFACGRYEGIDQRVVDGRSAADAGRRGQHRRLRARRRRGGRAGDGRGGGPAGARRAGQPGSRPHRTPSPTGCSRPRLHAAGGWRGLAVPTVLRSGNHAAIARWRRDRALERTAARGPICSTRCPRDALDAARPGGPGRARRRRG